VVDDEVDEADERHQQFLRVHYHNLSVPDESIASNHEYRVNEEMQESHVYLRDEYLLEHYLQVKIRRISFLRVV
jgi:hypothetical protein